MERRLVFVLLDGLNAGTARRCMSYMQALCQAGQARYHELTALLPPLSRPLYATLLSGLEPAATGIVRNDDVRLCPAPTFFHQAQTAGLITA
ncbi:MAG: alkaline phosphatase family protein, partial [Desulfovibrionaceae bacterium]|nr:alkaline phosphatase family protein [Desulfovibrionaceae bacterium]